MKQEFIFERANKYNWRNKKHSVITSLEIMMDNNKSDLKVTVEPFKKGKSWEQLKGLYRLLGKIVPVLRDIDPSTYFNEERVKVIIKDQYGYYQVYKGIKLYKSLKDATIEDMKGMIETASRFGTEMGVKDCLLTNEEEQHLIKYYNI